MLHDNIIDDIQFYAHAGLYGQLFLFWIIALAAPNSLAIRAMFFISAAITTLGPYGGFYGICAWYAYDGYINDGDENGVPYATFINRSLIFGPCHCKYNHFLKQQILCLVYLHAQLQAVCFFR